MDDGLGDARSKRGHARGEPRRHTAAMEWQIGEPGPFHDDLIVRAGGSPGPGAKSPGPVASPSILISGGTLTERSDWRRRVRTCVPVCALLLLPHLRLHHRTPLQPPG